LVGKTSKRTTAVSVKVSEDDLKRIEYIRRTLPGVFPQRSDFIKKVVPLMLYSLSKGGMLGDQEIPKNILSQGKVVAEEIAEALGIGVDELISLLISNFTGAA